MEHSDLVQEMAAIERMVTQDRLKHARKRRSQQLKRWTQYEKQLEKESSKKKKKQDSQQAFQNSRAKRRKAEHIRFAANIALLESAARNDLEEVRRLLGDKVSPDVTNEDGLTALHQCCIDDNEEMLKLLLEFNANVNACDSEMWTPLHAAATCGHVTLCKHLIDKGAELLAVNADGNMPYDICEDEITLDYIETEMAKRGITQEQIDDTRLTTEKQMLSDLKEFLSSGGDLETRDHVGASLLHIAAANGYMEVADFLLDNHVNVDARDYEYWQPIHAAAYWAQHEMLELLVQNAADLDAKTRNGETAFDLCEDPDMKQKILDMKDEIETNRASRQRPGSARKPKHSHSRNVTAMSQESIYSSNSSLNKPGLVSTSMRRSSVRGEKSNLFKKEAHEEALHFGLRMLQDEEDIAEVDEDKEHLPATNIDDVTITFDGEDHPADKPPPSRGGQPQQQTSNSNSSRQPPQPLPRNNIPPPAGPPQSGTAPPKAPPTSILTKTAPKSVAQAAAMGKVSNPQNNGRVEDRDPQKEELDSHFQNMFLERVMDKTRRTGPSAGSIRMQQQLQEEQQPQPQPQPQQKFYPPPMMMDKAKNGYNNNNNTTVPSSTTTATTTTPGVTATSSSNPGTGSRGGNESFRDGQLRRYVAPPHAQVVGGDESEKERCCVIL